ncbi:4,5-DOPA dioxygenase extradiol [Azotosporobacter soli]|uniref:4,5-DOPA-extradiol-dioxygenase n=1 Tax=Azotosporobacter soli TaxID=3055040 RepID=UPI0031FF23FD
MERMPVLFVGHGSPMNMVADNSYTQSLVRVARDLPRPSGILVVSAHWQTKGTWLTASESPQLIYDFTGFPEELYRVTYPCPGAFSHLPQGAEWLAEKSILPHLTRGLDHAAYAVLRHMYPAANIPVMELSLDYGLTAAQHYAFAKGLAPLREQGILVIGSGNIVHNLRMADFYNLDAAPYEWAKEFDAAVKECLTSGEYVRLIEYERDLPQARLAVPTDEHYLPLLYAVALAESDDKVTFFHEGFQNASMSMRCLRIG